mmetsp:Transcript_66255/g.181677  ORF Transcript_66255/g.181677 Transcript_66255/m.181677 type:complete len:98 (-) Transcript_66255:196-489(-)
MLRNPFITRGLRAVGVLGVRGGEFDSSFFDLWLEPASAQCRDVSMLGTLKRFLGLRGTVAPSAFSGCSPARRPPRTCRPRWCAWTVVAAAESALVMV